MKLGVSCVHSPSARQWLVFIAWSCSRVLFDICPFALPRPNPPCRPYSLAMSDFLALLRSCVLFLLVLSPSTLSAAGSSLQSQDYKRGWILQLPTGFWDVRLLWQEDRGLAISYQQSC